MARIDILLIDAFADWEAAPLAAAARSDLGDTVRVMTPDGGRVTSMGGLTAVPDLAATDWRAEDADALIVVGSPVWMTPEAPDVGDLLRRAVAADLVVGAICGATLAPARAGLLDDRAHTSNDAAFLAEQGGDYAGTALYVETPAAVTGGRLVTAPGSAPVTFAVAVLSLLHPERAAYIQELRTMSAREFEG
ncbi:DJ-1/PfpI family protein [Oharaeibacter diazotrophicus]|uniref:Putative intracellular protease/amidase n=1 Tax=Oharaeibacter diazotrophicus TaxID=1920512 RepID=A0A4R6RFU5_9HYPH|nr:DJ-1/PfpI family protein [Oharaeibacter diazotrophicus]TDP85150.1 putative intracellular protease/amidase [Oharaeibacter diazotrophicus]BBE74120.1 putative protease YdeA [Pleomorphomonas sp. SM30]GLS76192.1 glutamine amidotransferase [Oharaeibacter diazotrophicus]